MNFLIRCIDQPGGPELRRHNFQAHQDYLAGTGKVAESLISGPLVAQDAVTVTGSAYLVEAADSVAVAFLSCCVPIDSTVGIPREAANTAS